MVFVGRLIGFVALILTATGLGVINIALVNRFEIIEWLIQALALGMAGILATVWLIYSRWFRRGGLYRFLRNRLPLQTDLERITSAVKAFRTHKTAVTTG